LILLIIKPFEAFVPRGTFVLECISNTVYIRYDIKPRIGDFVERPNVSRGTLGLSDID